MQMYLEAGSRTILMYGEPERVHASLHPVRLVKCVRHEMYEGCANASTINKCEVV
jgi:hypothetical protein